MKKFKIPLSILAITFLLNHSAAGITNIDLSSWLEPSSGARSEVLSLPNNLPDKQQFRFVKGMNTMEIQFDGDISVGDNDRSISSISPGGYLKFSIRTFGNKRELTISSDRSGQLSYEYLEGRTEVPFEPEGRKWMEDVLIDVIRTSGIDAEGRTNRIFEAKGLNGFLDEIQEIGSNSVKRRYFSTLLSGHTLSNQELKAVAESITRNMSSDTERSRLFREHSDLFLQDNDVAVSYFTAFSRLSSSTERGRIYRNIDIKLDFSDPMLVNAYFQGIDRMPSNTERSSVLRHTIENQVMPSQAQVNLFGSVSKISSSTEAGRVIRAMSKIDLENRNVAEACFEAVNKISSDTEHGSALRHLLSLNLLADQGMFNFLNSCRQISSNTEKSRVLMSIEEINLGTNQGITEAYFNTVNTLSNTTEAGRVLRYTLEQHELDTRAMVALLESAARISSSTERSSILRASIPNMIYEQTVLDKYFGAVSTTASSTEQGRILRDLIERGKLDKRVITGILLTTKSISSNTEKGSVLRAVATKIPDEDGGLRDLYMETAKSLSSDSEYRKAVEAII